MRPVRFPLVSPRPKILNLRSNGLHRLTLMSLGIDSSDASGAQPCLSNTSRDLAERDFGEVADASPEMIWMADMDGLRTFSNKTWLEFRGRTSQQELGSGWAEGIHSEDRDPCLREYWTACARRRAFRLDYRISAADGSYYQVDQSAHFWFESSGQAAGYVGRFTVVTEREQRIRSAVRELAIFSARERQVLELIASGYATKEAATKLGISFKTADSHRSHVLKKLGLHKTASVVRFAIRSGLVEA
jgi:PAS domain S-box-containing protein